MDSPHFMRFCFLLLTIAASCPNIAMPSANRAEGTQISDKTDVTAYQCKDWEKNVCELDSYEGCEKIGETQHKEFSNKIIHLITSETHITMCFHQESTFLEGVYAIVWVKDVGAGDSCGTLNSEASLQNVSGGIICCEAEINLSVPNRLLKCYRKISDEEDRKSTASFTHEGDLGNPPFSVGEESSIGIIAPLLVIGICGAAVVGYCALQNRNRQGHVLELHHFFSRQT